MQKQEDNQLTTPKHLILIVDDNEDAALTIATLAEILGHTIQVAYDGGVAVKIAAEFKPDIALVDIGLPTLNGYEVAKAIRRQPEGERVYLIALTGWGQEEDKREAEAAGFDLHLVKPVNPIDLMKLFNSLPDIKAGSTSESDSG